MFKIPIADLKAKILEKGGLSAVELDEKIKFKINELSGLISEEGAAHIIANELGVELVPKADRLKIKEVYAGMKNISVIGKVVRKFEVKTFQKGDKEGKVCAIVIGDETGTIRVVFWDDQVNDLTEVKEDDIILVKDSYVRENRNDREIHLGRSGSMDINPDGEEIGEVRQGTSYNKMQISALQGGETGVELMGTVVQIFDPRFFLVHPETGKRIREEEDAGVEPVLSYVMNLVLDDGSGTIRAVFWKNQTNNLINKTEEEMGVFKEEPAGFEDIKTDLLGEQYKLLGKVVKNEMFDRLEFSVQMVEKANAVEELAKLE